MKDKYLKYLTIFMIITLLALCYFPVYAWQYGLSMEPTTTEYGSIEMPTKGMHWSTAPNGAAVFFFVSSTTTDGVFAQEGYVYNGLNAYLAVVNGSTVIPPHSWGMFWTYYKPGVGYVGNMVLPPWVECF